MSENEKDQVAAGDDSGEEKDVEMKEDDDGVTPSDDDDDDDDGKNGKSSKGASGDEGDQDDSDNKKRPEKKDYKDYPLKNISEPHDNDVLYGRGGGTNHHPGNKRYRKMVEDKKLDYVNSKRLDKPLVALEIIKIWRNQQPPGRFLKLDEKTGLWNDVGDKKAREKTSQALREKAPQIRKALEEERIAAEGGGGEEKSTRFADGTKNGNNDVIKKPSIVTRDTSLGPMHPDNVAALEGFSWQEGIGEPDGPQPTRSNVGSPYPRGPQPPPPPYAPPPLRYHYRHDSHGSIGSMGPPPPPPPPGSAYPPLTSDDRHFQYVRSLGRYESWGSLGPPPNAPPGRVYSGGPLQSTGSWGPPEHGMSSREHSLGQFPLPGASVVHPAPYSAFDGRSGSYGPYPPPPGYGPPPHHYYSGGGPPPPTASPSRYPPPPPPSHTHGYPSGHHRAPSNPRLSVDPAVASAWSGRPESEIVQTLSEDDFVSPMSPSRRNGAGFLHYKPEIIKRHTSNHNETPDAKPDRMGPSVKRAALNRDSSAAANRLKEICFPGQFSNGKFDVVKEVNELSEDMGRSRLGADYPPPAMISEDDRKTTFDYLPPMDEPPRAPRPKVVDGEARVTTLDLVAMDLAIKPKPMGMSSRSSTIDGLDLDGVGDVFRPGMERATTADLIMKDLERPRVVGLEDRMTTSDIFDIVNEPLADDDPSIFSGRRQAV